MTLENFFQPPFNNGLVKVYKRESFTDSSGLDKTNYRFYKEYSSNKVIRALESKENKGLNIFVSQKLRLYLLEDLQFINNKNIEINGILLYNNNYYKITSRQYTEQGFFYIYDLELYNGFNSELIYENI